MACKFIWGEVKELNGDEKTATYKPMFQSGRDAWSQPVTTALCESLSGLSREGRNFSAVPKETIDFDYCLICAGCNFGPFHKPAS